MKKHDYGLDKKKQLTLIGGNCELSPSKKVMMTNVRICKNRITVDKIAKCLEGWGLRELELAESVWLVEAVVNAINSKKSSADISRMFNFGLSIYGQNGYAGSITKESIAQMLYETLFQKIFEDDEKIVVKLKWRCLL